MKRFLPALLLLCVGVPLYAQQTVAVATPPVDPNQFMRTAADAMSLTSADMKPWHLRARYQVFNDDGSIKVEGVLEAWWAALDKFKISYTRPDFNQTVYRTGHAGFFVGSQQWPPDPEYAVSSLLLHPLPGRTEIDKLALTSKDVTMGATQLQCFPAAFKATEPEAWLGSRVYCFANNLPAVRVLEDESSRTSFNGIVRIDGHYLARQIRKTDRKGIPYMNIDVDQADLLSVVDEALFTPPLDARPDARSNLDFTTVVVPGHIIKKTVPRYPDAARTARAEGTVILQATIGTDGTVTDLKVVTGPTVFQQAAIDAVKTWQYTPSLLEGNPVAVETRIKVEFKGPVN